MTAYTLNYRFTLPDYNAVGWGDANNNNFLLIDSILAQFTTSINLRGLWTNATLYSAGQSVIDGVTGHIWYNAVSHVSAPQPTTFAMDRTVHADYWTDITNPAIPATVSAMNAAASAAAASQSATLAGAQISFRNRLTNGAMEVDQRNSGAAYNFAAGVTGYTLDRWNVFGGTLATTTQQVSLAGYTSRKQLSLKSTMSNAKTVLLRQRIEAANCADLVGKQVAVQFCMSYVPPSGTTQTFSALLASPTGVDDYTSETQFQTIVFTPTATPDTYKLVFDALPTVAANGLALLIAVKQNGGSAVPLDMTITSLSLESGATANAFERLPRSIEMVRCQRYYQAVRFEYSAYTAGNVVMSCPVITSMRVAPTATIGSLVQTNVTGTSIVNATTNTFTVYGLYSSTGQFQVSGTAQLTAEL